ncbi:MAG TPA: tyrosine-type recombinase/integrase [Propionibacteriaceae bacterium]|nr:tyrosine-type recombinase/integrase [Propionibacteriaceae bacterium]
MPPMSCTPSIPAGYWIVPSSPAARRANRPRMCFATEPGEPCDPRNVLRALKAAAKRAKLPSAAGLHTLRHSAASVMSSAGVPLKVAFEVFGHASVAITGDIYGHVSPEVSREALTRLSDPLSWKKWSKKVVQRDE